ncbi:MAG TPA: DinB family protein [Anaerolineales bacterium]|nr:DinB family protein [Anaerolineales bacterium]
MLNFELVREGKTTVQDLVKGLTKEDLRRELDEMYDEVGRRIAEATDADVVFQPSDPAARDPYATEGEGTLAWTLGHVIVHLTASMEEAASISQELARGVAFHGRSRWEVPYQEVKTIAFCRARLEESRRMGLAALGLWPDAPHMDNTYSAAPGALPHTAVSRYASGLKHASDHLEQISEILRQAKQAAQAR